MFTQYLHHIHIPTPIPNFFPTPSVINNPPWAGHIPLSYSPILKKKEKE
jgi:hypothetical protein